MMMMALTQAPHISTILRNNISAHQVDHTVTRPTLQTGAGVQKPTLKACKLTRSPGYVILQKNRMITMDTYLGSAVNHNNISPAGFLRGQGLRSKSMYQHDSGFGRNYKM